MLLIFGFLVGLLGTLVGVGGGVFIVPFLLLASHFPPQTAVGTSLLVILCNATSGSVAYAIQKRINYRIGAFFIVCIIPSVLIGTYALAYLPTAMFKQIFAVVLMIIAVYQIISRRVSGDRDALRPAPALAGRDAVYPASSGTHAQYSAIRNPHSAIIAIIAFGTGFIASLLGIGGGIIHIPVLIYLMGFEVHNATATSHFILLFTSLTAVIIQAWLGNIDYSTGLLIGGGAIIGAQAGAYLSSRIKPRRIIVILSLILILTALRLIFA